MDDKAKAKEHSKTERKVRVACFGMPLYNPLCSINGEQPDS